MFRIGVIADTHYPTRMPALPYAAIADAFAGVHQIVHVGDIETPDVLTELAKIAPVDAVKGDDDFFDLPLKRILEIGGVRIGVMHGQRSIYVERIRPRLRKMMGQKVDDWNGAREDLLAAFRDDAVNAILFGHWHRPYMSVHDGILLFNPGAVYALTLESIRWQMTQPQPFPRGYKLRGWLKRAEANPDRIPKSTAGILTIQDNGTLHPEIITLPYIEHFS